MKLKTIGEADEVGFFIAKKLDIFLDLNKAPSASLKVLN
jgi:hypothetical protein